MPDSLSRVVADSCPRCGVLGVGMPPLGALVSGVPPSVARSLNSEFTQLLAEVRDELIARGKLDLARNVDMRIPVGGA